MLHRDITEGFQDIVNRETFFCFIGSIGRVTEVKTDIYVTSFGPVSDVEMVRTLISLLILPILSSH